EPTIARTTMSKALRSSLPKSLRAALPTICTRRKTRIVARASASTRLGNRRANAPLGKLRSRWEVSEIGAAQKIRGNPNRCINGLIDQAVDRPGPDWDAHFHRPLP